LILKAASGSVAASPAHVAQQSSNER